MRQDPEPDDFTDSQELDTEFAAFEQQVARVSYAPPAPPLPHMGQEIAGKYRIDGLLGCGGMGAVFAVTHLGTDRPFAIKWLLPNLAGHPDAVQRFKREARASGKIVHPNVIQTYDIGEEGESHYIVMELLHGVTLAERLRQRSRFDVAEACRILVPVMRGVHAAHQAGVVHRDLKPQNIMLASTHPGEEIPKVLDFGISKIIPGAEGPQSITTRRGAVIGTPHYMSLEQLRSARIDARSDVYALGVVAYHMLSGALPFKGGNYADLVCQILAQTAQPLEELVPGIPAELSHAISRAMSVEPEERFASADEMARAFEPFVDVNTVTVTVAVAGEARSRERASLAPPLPLPPSASIPVELPPELRPARSSRAVLLLATAGVGIATAVWLALSGNSNASSVPERAAPQPSAAVVERAAPRAPASVEGWETPPLAHTIAEGTEAPLPLPVEPERPARPHARRALPRENADPKPRKSDPLRIRPADFH